MCATGSWLPTDSLDTGPDSHAQLSLKGRKATSFLLYHRTRAAYQAMPDADGEYCRMGDSLPQSIAANALEYSKVPLCVHSLWVLLLMYRILGDHHIHYILVPRWYCKCATTLQNLFPCPPIPHFSSKLHCTSKFPTEVSKTGPLHTFCIHQLWGLRVSSSTDMVQPSPQLNCVSGGITPSSFRSWQSNPVRFHRCTFTQSFNTVLQFLLEQENWSVAWLHDHLL